MRIPDHIQQTIDAFSRLPGIGPKTASRLTFYLLRQNEELADDLSKALSDLSAKTAYCKTCFNITTKGQEECPVCSDSQRNHRLICVVEEPLDVIALERIGSYQGVYHVLHGVLSPIEGVGPDDIRIKELLVRTETNEVEEVIVATNPNLEGDATANYIAQRLGDRHEINVTRLARGIPMGGEIEYADQITILRAMEGREKMNK